MEATAINCNSELIRERKQKQAQDAFVWNEFELLQQLRFASRYDEEVRYARMYALAAIAKHKGYKLSTPKAALAMEDALVRADPEHVCDPEQCQQLNMKCGQPYIDPDTERVYRASGAVFFCLQTGTIHICPPGRACNRSAVPNDDPTNGFVCLLTGQCKGTSVSNRPKYAEDQRVSKNEIDAIENSDLRAGQDPMGSYVTAFEENDPNAAKLYANKEWRRQNFNAASNLQILRQYQLRNQGLGVLFNATGTETLEELAHELTTQQVEAQRHLKTESKRRLDGKAPRPKRVKRSAPVVARAELTPDQRSEQYMRRIQGKAELLQAIVEFVTGSNAKRYLLAVARANAQEAGAKKVLAAFRRSAKRRYTSLECFSIWLRAAQPKMRPRPLHWRLAEPEIGLYVDAIRRLWTVMSYSPHARDLTVRRKHPISVPKVAFGMLYKMGSTGLVCDCTLPQDLLQMGEVQREAALYRVVQNFRVIMLPYRPTLAQALLAEADVQALCGWEGSGVKYDKHIIFQGTSLLAECYTSIVTDFKTTLGEQLARDPSNATTYLQTYIDNCLACKIVL